MRASRRSVTLMPRVAGARTIFSTPKTPYEWEAAGYEVSEKNGAPKIPSLWNKWFPYEPIPFSPQLGPMKEKVEAGVTYQWCSCGESLPRDSAWCDGVGCKDTKFVPMIYTARHTGPIWFC